METNANKYGYVYDPITREFIPTARRLAQEKAYREAVATYDSETDTVWEITSIDSESSS